jgi:hypothetical protein
MTGSACGSAAVAAHWKIGKSTSPTQGSKAEKPKIQVSTLQKKNPTDKRWG